MTDNDHESQAALYLYELPEVVQNAVLFSEVLLRVGFELEAITFECMPATRLGLADDREIVVGRLRDRRIEFGYALGFVLPDVGRLIKAGIALWNTADLRSRELIWEESELTQQEHLLLLLNTIVRRELQSTDPTSPAGDVGAIPQTFKCQYAGAGTRAQIQTQAAPPRSELHSLPLAELDAPTDGRAVERVAAVLGRVITDNMGAQTRAVDPEQMSRALSRSVLGVDLRPIDRDGCRVSGSAMTCIELRAWMRAKAHCSRLGIRAWFHVSYEPRHG